VPQKQKKGGNENVRGKKREGVAGEGAREKKKGEDFVLIATREMNKRRYGLRKRGGGERAPSRASVGKKKGSRPPTKEKRGPNHRPKVEKQESPRKHNPTQKKRATSTMKGKNSSLIFEIFGHLSGGEKKRGKICTRKGKKGERLFFTNGGEKKKVFFRKHGEGTGQQPAGTVP